MNEALSRFFARVRARRPLWGLYPTRRLAEVVVVLALVWLIPAPIGRIAGLVAVVALILVLIFDYVRLPGTRHVTVERAVPDALGLGDRGEATYRLRSAWPWRARVELFDALPASVTASADRAPNAAIGCVAVNAENEQTLIAGLTGMTRGRHELGEMALRITTPLGLIARVVRRSQPVAIVVVPSLTNVRRVRLLAVQNRLSDVGVRALKQRGEGSAFGVLRDYVPGDDPRLIDWKASARHQHLITREQTIERSQTVISLIDCGRAMTQLAGQFSRFEHVLSSALLLSDVAVTSGDRVGLIAFDDRIRAFVPPLRGRPAVGTIRSALGGLDATLTEPDYASAFRMLATRQRRRALVVFFTDVVDERTARQFVAYAGRAAQRHAVVIVAIQNDALIAASRPNTTGTLALYRSAAAEELVKEREEALTRMRRAGVTVLDVPPDRMATAVVNRYLEVKAKGII